MRPGTTQHANPRRGALAALLATVWVCLGLQPCAVAAVGDTDCPHCPAGEAGAMPGSHDHGDAGNPADCGETQASCCDAAASAIDGRLQPKKVQDSDDPDLTLAPAPAGFEPNVRKTGPPERPPEPLPAATCSRRLHLLNCVFRD